MSRRLFIGLPEINFINAIDKELLQDVVGQKIMYYAVSEQLTTSDDLYGEAIKKETYSPVEINALVRYNPPVQTVTQFHVDTSYNIEIFFHLHELNERNIEPKEGDFVKYGHQYYEVEQLTRPQIVFGQIDHKVQVRAVCRIARKGQFRLPSVEGVNEP